MEFKQELDKETKTLFKITKENNVIRLNWEELKQLLTSIKDTCGDLYDENSEVFKLREEISYLNEQINDLDEQVLELVDRVEELENEDND